MAHGARTTASASVAAALPPAPVAAASAAAPVAAASAPALVAALHVAGVPSPIERHIVASAAFVSLASTCISSLLPCMSVLLIILLAASTTRKRISFIVRGRAGNKRRRREGVVDDLFELNDAEFLRMMRMPKVMFLQLASLITPHLRTHWTAHSRRMAKVGNGSEVLPQAILAATIRWLAGGSVWDVAFMMKISSKTFHNYKWRVIDALNYVLRDNIAFPTSDTGLCALAQGFRDRDDNVPNVVAAVDAVVLEMRAPTSTRLRDKKQTNISSQYCRKGFFATTMLAFVDANMRFLSISISCGSSSHDSTLFGCSEMGQLLSKPSPQGGIDSKWVVAGDDAFKTLPHVMTPYQKQWLTNEQKNFNYCLSKLARCS